MTGKPLRTVMVGFGRVAAGYGTDPLMTKWFPCPSHLSCITADRNFRIVGIADPNPEARRMATASVPDALIASDAAELSVVEPDVAVLALPPCGRLAVLEALPSLRGVMLEKPLGDAIERAGLQRLAAERNLAIQVHYWRRGDPALTELANGGLLRQIGKVQTGFALYGNGLKNNGSHLVDMIMRLLGPVRTVRAIGADRGYAGLPLAGDSSLTFALEFESSACIQVGVIDYRHYREIALDLWGETGRFSITQEGLSLSIAPRMANRGVSDAAEIASDNIRKLDLGVASASPNLYRNLALAIGGGAALASPLSDALIVEAVLDAVLQSANDGGRTVEVGF